jgi:hypothetical protein
MCCIPHRPRSGDPGGQAVVQTSFHALAGRDTAQGDPPGKASTAAMPCRFLAASPAADRTAARWKHAPAFIGKRILANVGSAGGIFGLIRSRNARLQAPR